METQKPSVGRIVLYKAHGSPVLPDGTQKYPSIHRAAIITAVHKDEESTNVTSVDVCVLNPEGFFFKQNLVFNDEPGQLSWPIRN